jgi:hypothetical protein
MPPFRQRRKCHAHSRADATKECRNWALEGQLVCASHGGNNPAAREKALQRLEVDKIIEQGKWQLEGHEMADPGDTLLMLISAWKVRAIEVGNAIQELVAKAEGDLEKALTSSTYMEVNGKMVKVGEHAKGLVELEYRISTTLAGWSSTAIKAGLEERRVRVQERNANDFAQMVRALFADEDLALTSAQRQAFNRALERAVERKQLAS